MEKTTKILLILAIGLWMVMVLFEVAGAFDARHRQFPLGVPQTSVENDGNIRTITKTGPDTYVVNDMQFDSSSQPRLQYYYNPGPAADEPMGDPAKRWKPDGDSIKYEVQGNAIL
jgi:hypothetical protein